MAAREPKKTRVPAVTARWLRDQGACHEQLGLFRQTFGKRAAITRTNLRRAVELQFDLEWLTRRLLTTEAFRAYKKATDRAWKAYEKATAPALEVFRKDREKAYVETQGRPWEDYEEATATVRQAYLKATAPAWKAYVEARADVLTDLLDLPESEEK